MTRGTRRIALLCMLTAITVLPGCANVVKEQRTTTITTEPPGATVFASGVEVGVTPITVRPDEVFPPRFVGFEYRAAGTLSIKKAGCKTYSRQVNDAVLSNDIHVKLECDPAHATAAPEAPPVVDSEMRDDFTVRLRRLDNLRHQELITPQEYQQLRRKILNEL